MTNSFHQYLSDLNACLAKMEACGEDSRPLDFKEASRQAIDLILRTNEGGKKIIFIGNGGSAAIASHQAVDLWKNGGVRALTFNDASLLTCVGNDFGYEQVFAKPIEMFAEEFDLLIAISSSGRSQNILQGARRALEKNCRVITLSGFRPDNPLRSMGHLNFYVASESYGFVEISHLTLCHHWADQVMIQGTTPMTKCDRDL